MKKLDNPPAFPSGAHWQGPDGYWRSTPSAETGMSLRDWFAGQALAGLLASNAIYAGSTAKRDLLAGDAYAHADAMLAERAKGGAS